MNKLLITIVLACASLAGMAQAPIVKFFIQPDRSFKTAQGESVVEFTLDDFSVARLHTTALMAAQYVSGQPCSYVEGRAINIHQYGFYSQLAGKTITFFFNFCIELSETQRKLYILAPKWDHTSYDGRNYYWNQGDFFDKNLQRKESYFGLEEWVNNFLNGILQVIYDNRTR